MISLREACQKILAAHPKEYIHVVNEYDNVYQFCLLNKGEIVTDTTFIFWTPAVVKSDGRIIEKLCGVEKIFNGEYKQYNKEYIENLLREPNSSRA